jgi:hypothetical protein
LATIGWHGWMKAAGAFMGLPRELRHNMRPIYCENRNEATLQRLFQDCAALRVPSRQERAVVRAGLVTTRLALSFAGAIRPTCPRALRGDPTHPEAGAEAQIGELGFAQGSHVGPGCLCNHYR